MSDPNNAGFHNSWASEYTWGWKWKKTNQAPSLFPYLLLPWGWEKPQKQGPSVPLLAFTTSTKLEPVC